MKNIWRFSHTKLTNKCSNSNCNRLMEQKRKNVSGCSCKIPLFQKIWRQCNAKLTNKYAKPSSYINNSSLHCEITLISYCFRIHDGTFLAILMPLISLGRKKANIWQLSKRQNTFTLTIFFFSPDIGCCYQYLSEGSVRVNQESPLFLEIPAHSSSILVFLIIIMSPCILRLAKAFSTCGT